MSGPNVVTALRMHAVRKVAVTLWGVLNTRAKGVEGGAECD